MPNFYMPEVDPVPTDRLAYIFNIAHQASLGQGGGTEPHTGERGVSMISPGRLMRRFLAPPPDTMAPEMVQTMKNILPPPSKRVVAIAFTATLLHAEMSAVAAAIPFFGFLLGFAYIGHSVMLFEGHPTAFEAGTQGADMLLVDSNLVPFLPEHWTETAFRVMRTPEVNVFNAGNPQHSRVQRIVHPIDNPYNRNNT